MFEAVWALIHDSIGSWELGTHNGREETETHCPAALKTNCPRPHFALGYL